MVTVQHARIPRISSSCRSGLLLCHSSRLWHFLTRTVFNLLGFIVVGRHLQKPLVLNLYNLHIIHMNLKLKLKDVSIVGAALGSVYTNAVSHRHNFMTSKPRPNGCRLEAFTRNRFRQKIKVVMAQANAPLRNKFAIPNRTQIYSN